MSPPYEKVGGTRPRCPPPNCAHECTVDKKKVPVLLTSRLFMNMYTEYNEQARQKQKLMAFEVSERIVL